jgi:hypothetical protein
MEQEPQLDNFIRVFDNVLTPEQCKLLIQDYKTFEKNGGTYEGEFKAGFVSDNRCSYPGTSTMCIPLDRRNFLYEALYNNINEYIKEYPEAFPGGPRSLQMAIEDILIQKTPPSGGYHVWHSESMDVMTASRSLVWMFYLNDIEEGGETEFLYQRLRIKPKAGSLVVWPPQFTHTHRGNPPLNKTKYIITGWHRWAIG